MRYCKLTREHGLVYTSSRKRFRDPWIIVAYADSDWATWKWTRRSRMGWLIYVNGNLLDFDSKLQSSVALRSCEAEYMSISNIVKILLWIVNIIESIPGQFVRRPITIYEDNQSAINLASNHAVSKFTSHIGIAHHFLREHNADGTNFFKLVWIDSKSQIADGMTKPLPRADFEIFQRLVVRDLRF